MKAVAFHSQQARNFPPVTEQPGRAAMAATATSRAFPLLRTPIRPPSSRIAIKVKGKILLIQPGDAAAIEAQGNHVVLHRGESRYLLHESISAVAEKLAPHGFIRIHRPVLVNRLCVEEITPYSTGDYGLRMKGGKEYTVTRTYKNNLKSLAELSIGAGSFFRDLRL
ncbi:MAG: LytR/AlgR family response regulator transcription factor [Terracidiphilus sp.]